MANFFSKLTAKTTTPVVVPEQAQNLGALSVGKMLKATDSALIPSNAQQVATLNLPVLTKDNFGKKPISSRDVKAMESYANIVSATVDNGKKVLDKAARMKEKEADLASAHATYLQRVSAAELRVQRANTKVGVEASKSAVAHHRLGLHLQNAIGSAKAEISLNTAQYEASCAW
jgi:hypothetical protein